MKVDKYFWPSFIVCAVISLIPIWMPIDLANHAAQISILRDFHDPSFGYETQYRVVLFTPYLLGINLAVFFSYFMSVLIAVKTVLSISLLTYPLSLYYLVSKTGGDPYWALAGFPLFYGSNFIAGHFNFLVAVPVGILVIVYSLEYSNNPNLKRGHALFILLFVLFFCHLLVFGMAFLSAGMFVFFSNKNIRSKIMMYLPLLGVIFLPLLWIIENRTDSLVK